MPDPDARLDLGALMEGKASDPSAWPQPFRDDRPPTGVLDRGAPGHFVRIAREGA